MGLGMYAKQSKKKIIILLRVGKKFLEVYDAIKDIYFVILCSPKMKHTRNIINKTQYTD